MSLLPLAFALITPACAEVTLASVFTDHAVLQRDKPLPVWGKADPGEMITVALGSEKITTTTNPDGKWQVYLPAQPVSKDPLTLTLTGKNTITRSDILLGDVWLCGGQSNMDLALGAIGVPDEIASADLPLIRHFRVGYHFANSPADEVQGNWQPCSPGTAPGFSAVGYYFGKKIHAETGVPIGLLTNAVGGTNIELWISQEKLLSTPSLESYAETMRVSLADYQKRLSENLPAARDWVNRSTAAAKLGMPLPMPPNWPEFPFSDKMMKPRCVTLFNGMLAPLVPFSLRGVIWYQGENNSEDALYVEKKTALISDWRELFRDPDLPFYYVQLAAWQQPDESPEGGGWGMIRDLQRQCLAIPHTGMAVTTDVGDADDIHPKNKQDVGGRLALWALRNEYGQKDLVASGPLFESIAVEGDKLRIRFSSSGGGLVTASKNGTDPAIQTPDAKPKRFAIAGEDKKWIWADAEIDGDTIILSAPGVPHPAAARYAYSSNPEGANLYNRDGLPASPFRTDR